MSHLKNSLPGIPRKYIRVDIDTPARIAGRTAIYPAGPGGESIIKGLIWVGNWLAFYQWSNGLMPSTRNSLTTILHKTPRLGRYFWLFLFGVLY